MTDDSAFLPRPRLQSLIDTLAETGFDCVGPQIRDGAIVYDVLADVQDLPWGVTVEQAPGRYRVLSDGGERCFAWANGPQALKPLVFAPEEPLWHAERSADGRLGFRAVQPETPRLAVIGVRACDLAALYIHDKHFLHGEHQDPYYRARRQNLFLVAVNCTHPAATCFCASTGDGPRATYGFDIALTELDDGFVVQALSAAGLRLLDRLPTQPATAPQIAMAESGVEHAAGAQVRRLPGRDLRDALFATLDHPHWEDVGERCLACGSCTAVCPTCFCHCQGETPALDGSHTRHYRQWDSCFGRSHSYIHGMVIRDDRAKRYRQWLTHKLAGWHDQYGRSGCVGCGRCITWCPVGIDLVEEVAAIHAGPAHE